jgi:hypothetical protein
MRSVKTIPPQREAPFAFLRGFIITIAFSLDIRNNGVYVGFAR